MTETLDPTNPLAELRTRVRGAVLGRGEPGHDEACLAWNRVHRHHPDVVVVAEDAADVAEAVRFAAATGRGLAVQATGHGVARPAEGGVLLLTHRLQELTIDPEEGTAWVGAGVRMGAVLAAAQDHGLAPLVGSSPEVGAVGYTLGGGVGWLARKYGTAADSVRQFRVVTPAGAEVRAARDEHPELFWALRGGGGGSLGVVTAMEIELFPVTNVYGGNLLYPAEMAGEILARYAEWVTDAPDELTSAVVLLNCPPTPDVPEALRGRSWTVVRGCWCGPLPEGEALLDEWRSLAPPVVDLWGKLRLGDVASISNDPVDPLPAVITGACLAEVTREVADVLAARTFSPAGAPPVVFSEVRHLGGALGHGARRDGLGPRQAPFLFHAVGFAPTPAAAEEVARHHAGTREALGAALDGTVHLNFVDGEERRARTRDAFTPESYERLRALKAELDPNDVLRYGVDLG